MFCKLRIFSGESRAAAGMASNAGAFEGPLLEQAAVPTEAKAGRGLHLPSFERGQSASLGFVHELLVQSTLRRDGVAPTKAVVAYLTVVHRRPLESGNATYHTVLLLQDQLAEADEDVLRAVIRERDLEQALQAASRRIAEMAVRERELEAARRRHAEAERRCEELERRLDGAARAEGLGSDLHKVVQAVAAMAPSEVAVLLPDTDPDYLSPERDRTHARPYAERLGCCS
ncbi:hypothetical protein GCM10011579_067590 [Streptomyces albiflavescens]|uniref:Uncharacterized protein n=1 Tax=Streptomyces albiflavescens TaxID=1623582 RepID=A0A917YBY7_9ACTN|nr:hypothetical protein [Streptomyces albiflavescens]GGN81243.1 hypothetical protein GCM10011579_067590 [Streptomyces albiflavescens]